MADFREPAVKASEALLDQLQATSPAHPPEALDAGISVCMPAPGDDARVRVTLKRFALVTSLFMFGGIVAGGVVAGFASDAQPSTRIVRLAYAAGIAGIGVLAWIGFAVGEPLILKRYLMPRIGGPEAWRALSPFFVRIEEAATYNRFKMMAEDLGILIPIAERRCVQIEGLSHRYLIQATDVIELRRITGTKSDVVVLSYRIGPEILSLAVIAMTAIASAKKQFSAEFGSGAKSPTLATLSTALGISGEVHPQPK
jgi:hypothetical protein